MWRQQYNSTVSSYIKNTPMHFIIIDVLYIKGPMHSAKHYLFLKTDKHMNHQVITKIFQTL